MRLSVAPSPHHAVRPSPPLADLIVSPLVSSKHCPSIQTHNEHLNVSLGLCAPPQASRTTPRQLPNSLGTHASAGHLEARWSRSRSPFEKQFARSHCGCSNDRRGRNNVGTVRSFTKRADAAQKGRTRVEKTRSLAAATPDSGAFALVVAAVARCVWKGAAAGVDEICTVQPHRRVGVRVTRKLSGL